MKTSLARWGNNLAVKLPRAVIEEMKLVAGSSVEIKVEAGAILLRPALPRYTLDQLLRRVTRKSMRKAWVWGADHGCEADPKEMS